MADLANLLERVEEQTYQPGVFPFERGIHPEMYGTRLWTMRQYAGFGDPLQTNERFRQLLGQGQTGLSLAFDLPTQLGYDPDHPYALGEVGKVGVSVSTVDDLARCFTEIDLSRVSTSMTINATAPILFGMYCVVAKQKGVSPQELRGTTQNDILKEYVARNLYIFNPTHSLRLFCDLWQHCAKEGYARWNPVSVSGYHIRESGATPVQEVAITLANAVEYVSRLHGVGIDLDNVGSRISFFFNSHIDDHPQNSFYSEVAKLRAARRIWAKIMRYHFGITQDRPTKMRMHVQTAGSSLTSSHVDVNVARVTLQALAAIYGGTQSLHTNSKDEALGIPTAESAITALRTQQILASEVNAHEIVDPLGEIPQVRMLTNQMERDVCDYFRRIDQNGGTLTAITSGFFEQEIGSEASAYQQWRDLHPIDQEQEIAPVVFRPDESRTREHIQRLCQIAGRYRQGHVTRTNEGSRNHRSVKQALQSVKEAAGNGNNVMPPIISALEAHTTLGEITATLEQAFTARYNPSTRSL